MTLSSLQARAPRVILSGFSPSNCTEKTKRKPCPWLIVISGSHRACNIAQHFRRTQFFGDHSDLFSCRLRFETTSRAGALRSSLDLYIQTNQA